MLVPGGSTNDFTAHLARFYQGPARLRCRHELTISQGWASAVCVAQRRLRDGELAVDKPVLVLCTEADTVLSAKGILLWSKLLSPLTAEPLDAPLLTKGLWRFQIVSPGLSQIRCVSCMTCHAAKSPMSRIYA